MRILHVNKFFDLHGGAEVYMHRLMEKQRELGHEVHALSTRSLKNLPSDDNRFFVARYDLDHSDGPRKDAAKAINYVWNIEAEGAMERALSELKPDIIHAHNLYHHLSTSVLAPIRKQKIPCVQTLHDYKLACPNYKMFTEGSPCERCKGGKYWNAVKHHCLSSSFLPNVLAAFEMGMTKSRQSYEKTMDYFICPSQFIQEKMEDWGEPKDKLVMIPNPAELPADTAPSDGGYLVYVGKLDQRRGLESFIKAAALVPELPVKLVGNGPDEASLKSLVRSLAANHIEFLGFKPPTEAAEIRRHAVGFILPSINYENSALAILEAMGDGLPCLVTRIGGNPELVEDGVNGFLAHPDDVEDWTRTIRRFQATTPAIRAQMGKAGRERIRERHAWPAHTDRVIQLYRQAQQR
jgi:glycosyltransferase involved in cell wall biosynthesis